MQNTSAAGAGAGAGAGAFVWWPNKKQNVNQKQPKFETWKSQLRKKQPSISKTRSCRKTENFVLQLEYLWNIFWYSLVYCQ